MIVKDDVLSDHDLKKLREEFYNSPWMYDQHKVNIKEKRDDLHNHQLVHHLYMNYRPVSPLFEKTYPILNKLTSIGVPPLSIIRMKANMTFATDIHYESGMHIDEQGLLDESFDTGVWTAIYYFNNNNGYTLFEDGTKVESKANRLVIFDAYTEHCGVSCTDQKNRMVLNINFISNLVD